MSAGREKSPAFQLYPSDDILSHGIVSLMTYAELGIYMHLVSRCWIDQSIPADVDDLVRLLPRAKKKEFEKAWQTVGRCFEAHPTLPDRLIHPDLEVRRARQAAVREVRKAAAGDRWDKERAAANAAEAAVRDANASDMHSKGDATTVHEQCPPVAPSGIPHPVGALSPSGAGSGAGGGTADSGSHEPNTPPGEPDEVTRARTRTMLKNAAASVKSIPA